MTDTVEPATVVAPEPKPRKRAVPAEKRKLFEAFIAAQADMPSALKNRTNPFAKAKYADLQAVLDAIKPTLAKHKLGFVQQTTTHIEGTTLWVDVETIVFDAETELSSGVLSIPVGGGNQAQAIGSAISYGRRYQALAFFGISSEDDDGMSAGGHAVQCSPDLTAAAQQAAARGLEAYQQWFGTLSPAARKELTESGLHAQLKAQVGA